MINLHKFIELRIQPSYFPANLNYFFHSRCRSFLLQAVVSPIGDPDPVPQVYFNKLLP